MNGAAIAVSETFRTSKNRSFVVDSSGRILQKTENAKTQNYFYANDKPVGSSGALAAADFDYNYTPVSDQYPAVTPGSYTVSAGDTLRGIALAVYGDAQLWYLIADANGLQSDADLTVGRSLTVPNKISNLRNAYDTYKPYEPGKIIGDLTPTLPNPPPPKHHGGGGCGGIGRILVAVVAIVVAFVVALYLTPYISEIAAGAVAGALGSVASQVVGNVLGVQDGFSWKAVALGAIGGAVNAALPAADKFASGFAGVALRAATSSIISQGIGVAVGLQDKFDWKSVAAAGISAGVGYAVGEAIGQAQYGEDWNSVRDNPLRLNADDGNTFGRNLVAGLAGGVVKQIVYGGKANWASVIGDAFGNALGNSLAYSATAANSAAQQTAALDDAETGMGLGSGLKLKPGQAAEFGRRFYTSELDSPFYVSSSASLADGDVPPRFDTQIGDRFTHTVQSGETAIGVAAKYGLSLGELLALNKLPNPNLIFAGQDLTVPAKGLVPADVSGAIEKAYWRWNASTVSQVAESATAGASVGGMCTPENPSGLSQTDALKQTLDPINMLRNAPSATIALFEAGRLQLPRETTWADDFADGVKGGIDFLSNCLKGVAESDSGWLGTTAKIFYPATSISGVVLGFMPETLRFLSHPLQSIGDAWDFGKTVYQHSEQIPELIDKWAGDWGRKSWYEQVADVAALGSSAYLGARVGNLAGTASLQALGMGSRWAWQAGASAWSRLEMGPYLGASLERYMYSTGGLQYALPPGVRVNHSDILSHYRLNVGGYLDPFTNRIKPWGTDDIISVDHKFPKSEIGDLPGFRGLEKWQQEALVNDTLNFGNFQPLPKHLNSSKGSSLEWSQYGGRPLNGDYVRNLRTEQQIIRQRMVKQIIEWQRAGQ